MSSSVTIKSGDSAITLTNPRYIPNQSAHQPLTIDGEVVDLTGASVLLLLKLSQSPYTAYSLPGAVDGPGENGDVKYEWTSGFPTAAGRYNVEWEVTFPGGAKLTFPNEGYYQLTIQKGLN